MIVSYLARVTVISELSALHRAVDASAFATAAACADRSEASSSESDCTELTAELREDAEEESRDEREDSEPHAADSELDKQMRRSSSTDWRFAASTAADCASLGGRGATIAFS